MSHLLTNVMPLSRISSCLLWDGEPGMLLAAGKEGGTVVAGFTSEDMRDSGMLERGDRLRSVAGVDTSAASVAEALKALAAADKPVVLEFVSGGELGGAAQLWTTAGDKVASRDALASKEDAMYALRAGMADLEARVSALVDVVAIDGDGKEKEDGDGEEKSEEG
eukprot:PLAT14699.1.p2 GENE.PLAT14699.1~~PLAT14699.1.p2  ORF type:complete len:165 (-),score=49.85 PLAT14699.1:250-744(-)